MSEHLTRKRNKPYTEIEEEFLKACVTLGVEQNKTNAEVARVISSLLGRTTKGIEQKLSAVKQELFPEEKKRAETHEEEIAEHNHYLAKEEKKQKINLGKEGIQSIFLERKEPAKLMPQITASDIGKRYKVRVYKVMPYGAFCETEQGQTGLLLKGLITTEFVEHTEDYLQVGDVFEAIVVPDKQNPGKALLNAKKIGNILSIEQRKSEVK